jgi:hypothetical protein
LRTKDLLIRVKIDSTCGKYDGIDGIKEFKNLQDAIWYCWKIADEPVIVSKPWKWDNEMKNQIKQDYDFDLEIYDDYRE